MPFQIVIAIVWYLFMQRHSYILMHEASGCQTVFWGLQKKKVLGDWNFFLFMT